MPPAANKAANKIDVLLGLARKGPMRARDVTAAGVPRAYLRRLCDRGLIEQVDRGLYRLVDAPVTELHSLAEVAKRVPNAIVCLLSALQVHELTTEAPHAVWVLIDRHARTPKVAYPKLEVVRASGSARVHGVENHTIEGVRVQITTPAKTVADCFRYRRRVGLDVALAALRDYLARSRGRATRRERRAGHGTGYGYGTSRGDGHGDPFIYSIDALVDAARADRIYGLMRSYIEALA